VGARELIRQFGSAEECIRRAAEVKRTSYREALQKYAEFVRLSKELSVIHGDAPVELDLDALARREPDWASLRNLYAELGFTSLLKELPAATTTSAVITDYAAFSSPTAVREFLDAEPSDPPMAVWL